MSMKLDCPRRELSEALSLTSTATRSNSPTMILQNLKLEAHDGGLRVLGCDGEMWIERELACMVHTPGAACVQARLISDLVSSLPDGDVQLSILDHHGMLLQQGASEYRVLTQDALDYPEPPAYGGEGELTMNMGTLRAAIESVDFAVSADQHRPILTGVQFNYDGTMLTLVATDTHRLAVKRLEQPGIGSNLTCVVPDRALKAIRSLPISDDQNITIRFGDGRLGVDAGGSKVVAQLLAGAYPAWERVVPGEITRTWQCEVDQLKDRVRRCMILARDSANRVKFKGDGNHILIAARSEEKGEAKEEVEMIGTNGDIEIAFNGKYILDALEQVPGPGVRIEMIENSRPAVIKPVDGDDGYFCVVMPMALG